MWKIPFTFLSGEINKTLPSPKFVLVFVNLLCVNFKKIVHLCIIHTSRVCCVSLDPSIGLSASYSGFKHNLF